MEFCPKSKAREAAVAFVRPYDNKTYHFCPVVVAQMLVTGELDFTLGVLDPLFILAPANCSPELCATLTAIGQNHDLSRKNIVGFGEHLPTHPGQAEADDPSHVFLRAVKSKR